MSGFIHCTNYTLIVGEMREILAWTRGQHEDIYLYCDSGRRKRICILYIEKNKTSWNSGIVLQLNYLCMCWCLFAKNTDVVSAFKCYKTNIDLSLYNDYCKRHKTSNYDSIDSTKQY